MVKSPRRPRPVQHRASPCLYSALIISGDIYDRSIPPPEAVELFDDHLRVHHHGTDEQECRQGKLQHDQIPSEKGLHFSAFAPLQSLDRRLPRREDGGIQSCQHTDDEGDFKFADNGVNTKATLTSLRPIMCTI